MKNRVNLWTLAALLCAITPNLIAAAYVVKSIPTRFMAFSPFGPIVAILALFFGFVGSPIYLTMLLGTSSVVLAYIDIRKRGARGNPLAVAALVLGTLEMMSATLRFMMGCDL